jgi:hypothetical protein
MSDPPLARPLVTRHCQLPRELRTVGEAIAMIEQDVPPQTIEQLHWIAARDKLHAARETQKPRDIEEATLQLCSALEREGWLH